MRIRYEGEAEEDLRKAIDFGIEHDLPDPIGFVIQLRERIKTLATQPKSGKKGREPGTQEWPLAGTVYNVVYRVTADEIQVVRVMPPVDNWQDMISYHARRIQRPSARVHRSSSAILSPPCD